MDTIDTLFDPASGGTGPLDIDESIDRITQTSPTAHAVTASLFEAGGDAPHRVRTSDVAATTDDTLATYSRAMRRVRLLTQEEELALGRVVHESRLAMTRALARLPAASGVVAARLGDVERGERLITDVFFAPFDIDDNNGTGEGRAPRHRKRAADAARTGLSVSREAGRALTERVAQWRSSRAHDEVNPFARRLEIAFRRLEPSFLVLREALNACLALDARVSTIEAAHSIFHADFVAGESGVDQPLNLTASDALDLARVELRGIELEVGADLTTLRACCQVASEAHAAYCGARERMVYANLRLAHRMARQRSRHGSDPEDLVQEALLGLMRAVDRYDYRRGYKFSTYAVQWIRQATNRAIADKSRTVRVPAHMHEKVVRLRKTARGLERRLGRDATLSELADASGSTPAGLQHVLEASHVPTSLDAPLPAIDDVGLHTRLADPAGVDPSDASNDARLAERVARVLDTLPPRDAFIVRMRHGIGVSGPHSLQDIGARLGVSRGAVLKLEARALAKLRARLSPDDL